MQPHEDNAHLSRVTTRWSLVVQAHWGDRSAMTEAQEALLDRYGGAIARYLLAALRDPAAAGEVAQEFALCVVRGDFRNADPQRGRFRDFVRTVLFHLVVNYQRQRQK